MNYDFPIINNINDVLPCIEGRDEFTVIDKEDYKVVNYNFADTITFPPIKDHETNFAILRECRGLKFDKNGRILARPFHKFFNIQEKEETSFENLNFSKPHIVLIKMDGSMVHPAFINENLVWMTKAGITDVSNQAKEFIDTHKEFEYKKLANDCYERNLTPIFEWCSRKQRIVIDYPEDQLVLTGIRENWFGRYSPYLELLEIGKIYNVPVVKAFQSSVDDISIFVEMLKQNTEIEDVVIRFDSGHMIKIKTDQYIAIHRAKDEVSSERKLLACILENKLDDLKTIFNIEDRVEIEEYEKQFREMLHTLIKELNLTYTMLLERKIGRKQYALDFTLNSPLWRQCMFQMYDGKFASDIVLNAIKKRLTNEKKFQELKDDWLLPLKYKEYDE